MRGVSDLRRAVVLHHHAILRRYLPMVLGITVLWNVGAWVGFTRVLEGAGGRANFIHYFLGGISGIFVLLGVVWILIAGGMVSKLLGVGARITLCPGRPVVGQSAEVRWVIVRGAAKVSRLAISLCAWREVRHSSEGDTWSEREAIREIRIVDTTHPKQIAAGQSVLEIPADVPVSSDGPQQSVSWGLSVTVEVPGRPGEVEEHPVCVSGADDPRRERAGTVAQG